MNPYILILFGFIGLNCTKHSNFNIESTFSNKLQNSTCLEGLYMHLLEYIINNLTGPRLPRKPTPNIPKELTREFRFKVENSNWNLSTPKYLYEKIVESTFTFNMPEKGYSTSYKLNTSKDVAPKYITLIKSYSNYYRELNSDRDLELGKYALDVLVKESDKFLLYEKNTYTHSHSPNQKVIDPELTGHEELETSTSDKTEDISNYMYPNIDQIKKNLKEYLKTSNLDLNLLKRAFYEHIITAKRDTEYEKLELVKKGVYLYFYDKCASYMHKTPLNNCGKYSMITDVTYFLPYLIAEVSILPHLFKILQKLEITNTLCILHPLDLARVGLGIQYKQINVGIQKLTELHESDVKPKKQLFDKTVELTIRMHNLSKLSMHLKDNPQTITRLDTWNSFKSNLGSKSTFVQSTGVLDSQSAENRVPIPMYDNLEWAQNLFVKGNESLCSMNPFNRSKSTEFKINISNSNNIVDCIHKFYESNYIYTLSINTICAVNDIIQVSKKFTKKYKINKEILVGLANWEKFVKKIEFLHSLHMTFSEKNETITIASNILSNLVEKDWICVKSKISEDSRWDFNLDEVFKELNCILKFISENRLEHHVLYNIYARFDLVYYTKASPTLHSNRDELYGVVSPVKIDISKIFTKEVLKGILPFPQIVSSSNSEMMALLSSRLIKKISDTKFIPEGLIKVNKSRNVVFETWDATIHLDLDASLMDESGNINKKFENDTLIAISEDLYVLNKKRELYTELMKKAKSEILAVTNYSNSVIFVKNTIQSNSSKPDQTKPHPTTLELLMDGAISQILDHIFETEEVNFKSLEDQFKILNLPGQQFHVVSLNMIKKNISEKLISNIKSMCLEKEKITSIEESTNSADSMVKGLQFPLKRDIISELKPYTLYNHEIPDVQMVDLQDLKYTYESLQKKHTTSVDSLSQRNNPPINTVADLSPSSRFKPLFIKLESEDEVDTDLKSADDMLEEYENSLQKYIGTLKKLSESAKNLELETNSKILLRIVGLMNHKDRVNLKEEYVSVDILDDRNVTHVIHLPRNSLQISDKDSAKRVETDSIYSVAFLTRLIIFEKIGQILNEIAQTRLTKELIF